MTETLHMTFTIPAAALPAVFVSGGRAGTFDTDRGAVMDRGVQGRRDTGAAGSRDAGAGGVLDRGQGGGVG